MKDIKYNHYFWQDDNIRLRSMQEGDWESYYYNRYDTPGRRLVNYVIDLPPTVEEAQNFANSFKDFLNESEKIMFTIEDHNGENLGAINLNSIDERNGTFSIGLLIDQDHRSKGYGTSAMTLVLNYAFYERRLNKYHGSVLEGNIGSATMLKKVGCQQEGIRTQMVYTDNKYHDIILFGLTKEQFGNKILST